MASKKSQTQKRIDFLTSILCAMEKHEIFSEVLNKKNDTENHMQKNLFLRLEKELPGLISSSFQLSDRKAKEIVDLEFKWEQKRNTHVKNFTVFATNHRPDATLDINGLRIAVEVKKGENGLALRTGIGQSIIYSTEFDFILYFFVDISAGNNIKSSITAKKESDLITSLWEYYNIKFIVV